MEKIMIKRTLLALFVLTLIINPCFANQEIANQIKQAVIKNMDAVETENTQMMMDTIHTQSPFYLMTKQQMQPLYENYELKYELLSYEYIGITGEYATVRVIFRTSKISGPAFKDNELDVIQIFKQENGTWKLWSQANLELKFLN